MSDLAVPLKTTADAQSYEEFQSIKRGEKVPAPLESADAEPETPKEPAEPSEQPAEPEPATGSESAAAPEAALQQEKPRRDRTAEGRIRELVAERESVKAELAELRKKLETLQVSRPAEPPAAAPATPQPAATPAASDRPREEEYDGSPGKTYADYMEALVEWKAVQVERKRDEQRRAETLRESVTRRLAEARAKHQDFDAATAGLNLFPALQQFATAHEQGMDVIYHLGANRGEFQRIATLEPVVALAELGAIAHGLRAAAAAPPATPQPPVSRVPAPPPKIGGVEAPAPKHTSEARDYEEFKRLKYAKR